MENFTITSPDSLDAALAAVQQQADTKFIAGGTDLMQLMKDHVERPQHLVDLEGLPLDTFSIGGDGARIGALVRMSDLADDPDLRRRYPVVAEALLASASPQVATWRRSAAICCSAPAAAISATSALARATNDSPARAAVRSWG